MRGSGLCVVASGLEMSCYSPAQSAECPSEGVVMSHKSKPGDGSHNNGTKGGGLYQHHYSTPTKDADRSLVGSLINALRAKF